MAYAWKIKERTGRRRLQARARILHHEHDPAPDRWGEVFGDPMVAAAMIDRLVHHATVVSLKGDSYRLKGRDLGRVPQATTNDS